MDDAMRRVAEQAQRALVATGEGMQKIRKAAPVSAPTAMHAVVEVIIRSYAAALTPVVHALGEDARALGAAWREAAIRAAREREAGRG